MLGFDFYKRHWGPIGLELGSHHIRMVQLCETREGLALAAAYEQLHSERHDVPLHVTLDRMLEEYDFHGRQVVLGLPSELLRVTPVRVAEKDYQQDWLEAGRQAAWRMGWNPDLYSIEAIAAGHVHPKNQAKIELLLLAVKHQDIRELLGSLDGSDIEVVGLDPLSCAVFRCSRRCMKRQGEADLLTAFIHVGRSATQVVFGQGQEITFIKQIPLGTENFVREITQKMDIDRSQADLLRTKIYQERLSMGCEHNGESMALDEGIRQAVMDAEAMVAEELCKELSLCLRYYNVTFRGQRIQQVLFSGGQGDEIVLQNRLSQTMHVPVKPVDPFHGLGRLNRKEEAELVEKYRQWAIPMGLALKGWPAEKSFQSDSESQSVVLEKTSISN